MSLLTVTSRLVVASRSLRCRVMFWNAGVVVVTALLILIGLREGVRRTLIRELDGTLVGDLHEVRLALDAASSFDDPRLHEALNRKAAGHRVYNWFARFVDADGNSVWVSLNGPRTMLPTVGPEGEAFGVDQYRLIRQTLSEPQGPITSIRVGASTSVIDEDVARIDRIVGVTVLIVLIAAPLCGYWLAGRMLRPIGDIIDTAARLRPNRLEERLPDRGSGGELDKLAGTVNGLLDRIADHLRIRRDFLANSAHELRSPLAAMRSTVEVALQSGRISPADEETFAVVIDQCRSLEHLVNQLLLIAETEAERLTVRREEVRLDRLVAAAAEMFSAAAELTGVSLETGDLPPTSIHGHRDHLRQVVNNLLDNAVKFTPAGGSVSVALRHDRERRTAILTVSDTGVGIATDDLPKVFDRFFRADRSRRREGRGTGLGLSICHAVVVAHGGTIVAESHEGAGTMLMVTLPIAEPKRDDPLPSNERTSELST